MSAVMAKKIEKKKRIIETAYQLFLKTGISATAIDDVVKSAGIARGTFYLYFKDKSDLLEQMIFYKSTETMKELVMRAETELSDGGADLPSLIRRFVELCIRFYADHKDVMMVLNKNMTSFLRTFPNLYDEEAQTLYGKITARFTDYGYREEEANKTIYIVIEMLNAVCADAVMYGEPYTLEALEAPLTEAAVRIIESGAHRQKSAETERADRTESARGQEENE